MKTIALALFVAALGCAQSQSSTSNPVTPPPPKAAPKATPNSAPKAAAPAQKSGERDKRAAQPATQQKAAQTQVQSIPAGATQVEPNLYRYTDSNGKTWNYRQTPFGISRWEETSATAPQAAAPQAAAKSDPVVVTNLGDSYRFEKKTPFGQSTWVRKKSELTDEEKALTEGQQTPSNPNQNSADGKPAGNR
jgi:hypothetical protein